MTFLGEAVEVRSGTVTKGPQEGGPEDEKGPARKVVQKTFAI